MNQSNPEYNSGYLVHLTALAKEAVDRFEGVPPFNVLIAVALFTHFALIAPVYLIDPSDDMPDVTQVRVAFGVDKVVDAPAKKAPIPKAEPIKQVVSNVDKMFEPEQAKPKEQPLRNPRSEITDTVNPVNEAVSKPEESRFVSKRPASLKRFGREGGASPQRPVSAGQSAPVGSSASNIREVVSKYERLLSGWVDRHKIYPDAAYRNREEGNVVLRLRINRRGMVIFKKIERSSGNQQLDRAVLETVTRASPMPAVPAEYPGGKHLEFLIPINFRI